MLDDEMSFVRDRSVSNSNTQEALIEHEKKESFYSFYHKLTPASKIALWSTIIFMATGVAVGLFFLLRHKDSGGKSPTMVDNDNFVLSGGGDVCGNFANISSIRGLNGSRWMPYTRIEFEQTNMTREVEWESCYTPDIPEGNAVITCQDNNQGCSLNGTGSLIQTRDKSYNVTFNVNATCDRYELYMLSRDVGNMSCRSIGSPLKSELSPEAAIEGGYFNLSFEINKQFGRRNDDDVVDPLAIGDYDCYTSHDEVNNSYAYTMGRYRAVCNRTNFCTVEPRMFGYTCEDDTYAWPRTTPCIYNVYMRDCPLNNTNSTNDDINKTVSLWQRLWQKPSLGRRDSLTLFTLPREAVNVQEEKEENHLRTGVYV